jgi:4-amino-4-deoxy-L-arabinose transferase-like glycosyltransferase
VQFLSRYKLFYPIFWIICLNFIFKSFIFPFFTPLPDYDTLEALYLGNFSEFGNYKHPPLLNFTIQLIEFFWNRNILALSLVSQLYLSLVYVFTFKLAKEFTNQNNAILATILIGFFPVFSTTSHIFHQDIIIILPFLTSIYFYHQLLQKNNISSAIYLGISIGLGMLGKYFFAIQVFTVIFHAIFFTKLLKNPKIYLAGLISILIFSPHIFWNFKNHFMVIDYVKSANINAGKLSPAALLLNGFFNVAIFILLVGLAARKMPNFKSLKINKNLNLILYFGIFNIVILFITMFVFGMEGKSRFLKMFMPIIPLFAIILIDKNFEVKQVKQFFYPNFHCFACISFN